MNQKLKIRIRINGIKVKRAEAICIPAMETLLDEEATNVLPFIMKKRRSHYYILLTKDTANDLIDAIKNSGILGESEIVKQ